MDNTEFRFNDIVEKIYNLPLEDKLELKNLLEHNITGDRRKEMALNFKKSLGEHKSGELNFSENIEELKRML